MNEQHAIEAFLLFSMGLLAGIATTIVVDWFTNRHHRKVRDKAFKPLGEVDARRQK